jgi:phosphoribosylformimino-5-aminoimidazole carboxamide ribotide isomerase
MNFDVIPAIDLRGGQVVRLKQGDYAQQTTYAADPRELAQRYADAGARWLHLVDLDGARSGQLDNLAVIRAIAADGMQVQAGGGVRSLDDIRAAREAGARGVILGRALLEGRFTVEEALAC